MTYLSSQVAPSCLNRPRVGSKVFVTFYYINARNKRSEISPLFFIILCHCCFVILIQILKPCRIVVPELIQPPPSTYFTKHSDTDPPKSFSSQVRSLHSLHFLNQLLFYILYFLGSSFSRPTSQLIETHLIVLHQDLQLPMILGHLKSRDSPVLSHPTRKKAMRVVLRCVHLIIVVSV